MITGSFKTSLPSLWTILPWFLLSAVSLLTVTLLLFFSADSFFGHYFHPKLLAITHIATIGFVTSIILGSLFQLLPVLMEVPLFSEKMAKITFVIFLTGLVMLCCAFWHFDMGFLGQAGSVLVFSSFLLFAANFWISIRKAEKWRIEADLISTSIIWLLLTGLAGMLLMFNFTNPFIPLSHLEILKVHAHMGLVGWFLLLIQGVSAKLIPMFLLSHVESKKYLRFSFIFNNLGLFVLVLAVFMDLSPWVISASALLITTGTISFVLFIVEAYKKRKRLKLDAPMKISMIAFMALIVVLGIAQLLPLKIFLPENDALVSISFGVSGLLGVAGLLIIGQSLKVVPFIIWIHKYQKEVGSKGIPQPKDLVLESLSKIVLYLFTIGIISSVVSVLIKEPLGLQISGLTLILASCLYIINILHAVFHKKLKTQL